VHVTLGAFRDRVVERDLPPKNAAGLHSGNRELAPASLAAEPLYIGDFPVLEYEVGGALNRATPGPCDRQRGEGVTVPSSSAGRRSVLVNDLDGTAESGQRA
jgi:hypothetical protein